MSRIKATVKATKRAPLNTTIDEEILNDFKSYCKELGLPMNMLVQSFMQGMIEQSLVLRIEKNNRIEIDEKEQE